MERLTTIAALRQAVAGARARGASIGFVPTMGYLHEGHLRLIDEARRLTDVVVLSVFVNPLQFAPHEDLASYPRDLSGDVEKASTRGAGLLFVPDAREIYPREPRVRVVPGALAERWEGEVRPGHFAGVLTVVLKLLNIVQPDVVVFGQKDVQQATVVRAMVTDTDLPVRVVVAPTVRDADGLAMSSRNSYLTAAHRSEALVLSRALFAVRDAHGGGETDPERLLRVATRLLAASPEVAVDYLALADAETLEPVTRAARTGDVVLVAARVGGTRLIDNVILGWP